MSIPDPWAWYRADDITGDDGDDVLVWPDRTSGGRDLLDLSGSKIGDGWVPQRIRRGVLDGQDATAGVFQSSPLIRSAELQANYDSYSFANGVTCVQVVAGDPMATRCIVGYSGPVGFQLITYPDEFYGGKRWGEFIANGGIGGYSHKVHPGPLSMMGAGASDYLQLWIDSHPLPPEADEYYNAPTTDWSTISSEWLLIDQQRWDTQFVGEFIVWDRVLDDAERDQVWCYLLGRYPELGIDPSVCGSTTVAVETPRIGQRYDGKFL